MDTILVNKLPTRTWNRLGVNETALLWDEAGTVDGGTEVLTGNGRLELSAGAPYARKTVEIAAAAGSFNYEFACGISRRVPRVYLRGGQAVHTVHYLTDVYHTISR